MTSLSAELIKIDDTHYQTEFIELPSSGVTLASNYVLGGTFGLSGNPTQVSQSGKQVTFTVPDTKLIGGFETITITLVNFPDIDENNDTATFTESNEPKISWFNETNDEELDSWNLGQLDAGTPSPDKTFLIWNNRGGHASRAPMQDCQFTTVNESGGTSGAPVADKWVRVRVDSMSQVAFTPVGGESFINIKAEGQADFIISGDANGASLDDKGNYAKITAHILPPSGASAGIKQLKLKVSYFFT